MVVDNFADRKYKKSRKRNADSSETSEGGGKEKTRKAVKAVRS